MYLKPLLQKCFELLTNGISIVKENVISAIAACAEAVGDGIKIFKKYLKIS